MQVSVTDAKPILTDLVRRAEAGEEILLTRHGQPAARIVALRRPLPDAAARRALMEGLAARAAAHLRPGPSAAESEAALYGADGLPRQD